MRARPAVHKARDDLRKETPGVRFAEVERETQSVRVRVVVDLDGESKHTIDTGIGYFDYVLGLLAFHGGVDLGVSAEGDLAVDDRHTVEAVGACIGKAIRQALGDPEGTRRVGSESAPVDDALVHVAMDIGGRPVCQYKVQFTAERIGGLTCECIEDFFRAVAFHGGFTIHAIQMAGHNNHHICESLFSALGLALRRAIGKATSK